MTRLTEEMVIARSRGGGSDLASIKKLNCWGSDLSDVSIIKRMRGVEVLALSVNKISSLAPFENCYNLQELYLRKNSISDINEIAYLQNLPNLKYLWLEENPCCDILRSNYRSVILRALPNLKKLDNIDVTPEEVEEAMKMTMKKEEDDIYEDAAEIQQAQQQQLMHEQQQQQMYSNASQPQRSSQSPSKERNRSSPADTFEENYIDNMQNSGFLPTPSQLQKAPSELEFISQDLIHNNSPKNSNNNISKDNIRLNQSFDKLPASEENNPYIHESGCGGGGIIKDRSSIPPSTSTHSMKEYFHSDSKTQQPLHYRHSQTDLTEWDESNNQTQSRSDIPFRRNFGNDKEERYRNGNSRQDEWEEREERSRRSHGRYSDAGNTVSNAVLNHYAVYHRRPVNRSSNLLSATLCLVKELDYPSLEVVEHAVRCRIDELSTD